MTVDYLTVLSFLRMFALCFGSVCLHSSNPTYSKNGESDGLSLLFLTKNEKIKFVKIAEERGRLTKCQSQSSAPSPQKLSVNLLKHSKKHSTTAAEFTEENGQQQNHKLSTVSHIPTTAEGMADAANDAEQSQQPQQKPNSRMRKLSDGVMNTLGVLWTSGKTAQI